VPKDLVLSWFISSGTTAAFIRVFSGDCLPGLTITYPVIGGSLRPTAILKAIWLHYATPAILLYFLRFGKIFH